MPSVGLLALFDDVAAIMDDVAMMSKVAAEKTVGLAGDDLAVNAEGLVGLRPSRELPILGKVALGSLANKFVLVPLALALPSTAIQPLLMLGGAFLCYEGVHKVMESVLHHDDEEVAAHKVKLAEAIRAPQAEVLAKLEAKKVKQAIITDVVLSAEIVAVSLGVIGDVDFVVKATSLSLVALGMTVGIYGLVAALVKLDDIGLWLQRRGGASVGLGRFMVQYTPVLMRVLSVVGTVAMFLVGGGILSHGFGIHFDHIVHAWHLPSIVEGGIVFLAPALVGLLAGGVVVAMVEAAKAAWKRVRPESASA